MKPATAPRSARELRILVVDATSGVQGIEPSTALPALLRSGDLVVVNDAATLPASLGARTRSGDVVELRLVGAIDPTAAAVRFTVALLGSGDHHTRTEDRPLPPRVEVGDVLAIGTELRAAVIAISKISARLVDVELTTTAEGTVDAVAQDRIWSAIYRAGKPVQYAHVPAPVALWDVQNAWAGRPWAVEMPSAGRALRIDTILELRRRGIEIAFITHAAGLSATGDPAIDACLPLPERFEVREAAARAIARTKARGGRVIAIGTSVVRALESAARFGPDAAAGASGREPSAASGITSLLLTPMTQRLVVDAVLTGVHESDTTHFTLLRAFAGRDVLDGALDRAERDGLLEHEYGDAWLVWGKPRADATRVVAQRELVSRAEARGGSSASSSCARSATFAT